MSDAQPNASAASPASTTVRLARPVRVIDHDVTEFVLREPTGADLVRAGYPVRITANEATEIDAPAMTKLIGQLASVPAISVERLTVRDWVRCMETVMGFFGNHEAA